MSKALNNIFSAVTSNNPNLPAVIKNNWPLLVGADEKRLVGVLGRGNGTNGCNSVTSANNVDLSGGGVLWTITPDPGVSEIVEVDFTGLAGIDIMSRCFNIRNLNGTTDSFYFIVNSSGGSPGEGTRNFAIEIDGDLVESTWVTAAAAVVGLYYNATANGNVLTIESPIGEGYITGTAFVQDGSAFTGFAFTLTRNGVNPVFSLTSVAMPECSFRIVRFDGIYTLLMPGGNGIVTGSGDYGVFVRMGDGDATLALFRDV